MRENERDIKHGGRKLFLVPPRYKERERERRREKRERRERDGR